MALRNVWIGSELPGRVCAFEFCHVCVAAGVSVTTAPGNTWCESTAATLKTLLPTEGEPTMWRTLPELPADATTMIPAFSALVEARESADWSVPKLLPSDMLITWILTPGCPPLRLSSITQLIASTTTSVLPSQPKTRTPKRSALGATPGPMRKLLL